MGGWIDGVAKRVDGAVRASLAELTLSDLVRQLPAGQGSQTAFA